MDMQQVEAFLAVADELHFGQAADRVVLSRPRVSRLIASLEREIGGTLFDRTSRRVRLTPLGARFRDRLRPGYAQLQAALAGARAEASRASGTLRVGITVTTGGEAVTRLVAAFQDAHPGCEVILQEVGIGDPYTPLRRDEIDVLVNWLAVDEPDLTAGPVIDTCARALAVSRDHPLAARPPASAESLADFETARIPPVRAQGPVRRPGPAADSGRPADPPHP
jgi:DNA-binding transcriptional LysR family regulator